MQEESLEACRLNEEDIRAIRKAKLREINTALDDLFVIGTATNLYKQSSIESDFKTFEREARETFEFQLSDYQSICKIIDSLSTEMTPDEVVYVGIENINHNKKSDILNNILSLDYTPPEDWKQLTEHLILIKSYYTSDFDVFHPIIEYYIDVSLCKLLRVIGSISVIERLIGNKLLRIIKINKALKRKVLDKITPVREIFFTDIIKNGMTMYAVTKLIREEFSQRQKRNQINKNIKFPSYAMIKEYLMGDEIIMKCF